MRRAIQLNRKLRVVAEEVDDSVSNRMLPAELVAVQLLIPKATPKAALGWSGGFPKVPILRDSPWHTLTLILSQRERESSIGAVPESA
jgi:hypothetical protein